MTALISAAAAVLAAASLLVPAPDQPPAMAGQSIPVRAHLTVTRITCVTDEATRTVHYAGCPLLGEDRAERTEPVAELTAAGYGLCPVCQR